MSALGAIAFLFVFIALVLWACVAVGSRHDMPEPTEPKAHEKKKLPYKTVTNADRIRSMTDEELARTFGGGCPNEDRLNCRKYYSHGGRDCFRCWLDWLKEEVSE